MRTVEFLSVIFCSAVLTEAGEKAENVKTTRTSEIYSTVNIVSGFRLLTFLRRDIIFQERIVMHQRTDCISRPWCTLIHWHPCVRARDTNKSQLGSTARGQKVHGAPLSCHSAQNYTQMLQKRHHDEYKGEQKFKSHYNLSC